MTAPKRVQPYGDRWRLYDRNNHYIIVHTSELRLLGLQLIADANRIDSDRTREIRNAADAAQPKEH